MAGMEIFRKCKAARREIACLQRQIHEMRAITCNVQSTLEERVQSNHHQDRMAAWAAQMDELEETLLQRVERYVQALQEAEEMLVILTETEALVMRAYYINGMTNEEVGESRGIADRHVRRAKQAATRKLRGGLDQGRGEMSLYVRPER